MATWMIRSSDDDRSVGSFVEKSACGLRWSGVRNLAEVTTLSALQELVDAEYGKASPGERRAIAEQLFAFRVEMKPGDGVVAYDAPSREMVLGLVQGDYAYSLRLFGSAPHTRSVQWQGRVHRGDLSVDARLKLGQARTIFMVRDSIWQELCDAEKGELSPVRAYDAELLEYARVETEQRTHDLLADRIEALVPSELERLVIGLLAATGLHASGARVGAGQARCQVVSPGGLGLDEPRVRVRIDERRRVLVDTADARAFAASLRPGERGFYANPGGFTPEARREMERHPAPVTLVDLELLVVLLLRHYEALPADVRSILPLARFYWPT
jgi:restriction system protein